MFSLLKSCTLCPRSCRVNRFEGGTGYCGCDAGYAVASVCVHRGEEPVISGESGICNIFFPHCNLQCVYCQNYQISRNNSPLVERSTSLKEIVAQVVRFLESGCKSVGFVTPTHYVPHIHAIIDALHAGGYHPAMVYNTNGYDSVAMLKTMEDKIDVYLPDFKYMNAETAMRWSGVKDYPGVAMLSIREMYRQRGSSVILSDSGHALKGLIIRHLVLPGQVNECKSILRWIAEELSPSVHISLMAQYYPPDGVACPPELQHTITGEEYESILEEMEGLGFSNGWIQHLGSSRYYTPDFSLDHPFQS